MKLSLILTGRECAKVSKKDGAVIVERMRFIPVRRPPNYDQTAWCPPAFKALYRRLRRKGLSATEARPLVEETIRIRSLSVPVFTQSGKA
jgi:hypothetical protein